MDSIRLTRPDDWHLHLRDNDVLTSTVPHSARCFKRAIVMPNLQPPVTTVARALDYRERIMAMVPEGKEFEPLMTLYLTDELAPEEIDLAHQHPFIHAVKYYPAGATTNSENGVTDIKHVIPTIERMAELGMPLLVHGEVTDSDIDIFDREKVFIERVLSPLLEKVPGLKLVLEHITTMESVQFVEQQPSNVAATITPHHLMFNRNDLLAGGVRPHFYCLPVLKRDNHQRSLIQAATSGNPKFFLGTDSAPHARGAKESACGCAGIYSAPFALQAYAQVFDKAGALDKLEAFASFHGPDFYGLPRNQDTITLVREPWTIPNQYEFGTDTVIPMAAGSNLDWTLDSQ